MSTMTTEQGIDFSRALVATMPLEVRLEIGLNLALALAENEDSAEPVPASVVIGREAQAAYDEAIAQGEDELLAKAMRAAVKAYAIVSVLDAANGTAEGCFCGTC